jgi:preprotein translocase subunit SecA
VRAEVLNARNDEREAAIITEAGRQGAVTISTNMAGRGVDIKLAGYDASRGEADPAGRRAEYERVMSLGGLYVIGTDRHESRRVDDQLRGRSGRQGEPGSSRFFISIEDPLFERFGVWEFLPRSCRDAAMQGAGNPDPGPITDRRVLSEVDRAQSIIEAQNHQIRRMLRKYSTLVELDRRRVRRLRDSALRGGELPPAVEAACTVEGIRPRVIQAFLCRLDRFWADHLAYVEDVREGIHLERYAGRDPGLEYINRVGRAFETGLAEVEEAVAADCAALENDPDGGTLEKAALERPSSTWTYQIDDTVPVSFNLSMIATSNIGAAALGALPLLVVTGIGRLLGRLRVAVSGGRGKEQSGDAESAKSGARRR